MIAAHWLARGACLALLLVPGAPAAAQHPALAGFDTYVEQAMRAWGVPGVAVAVVEGDSIVFARGYGVRVAGAPEVVDENTVFAIASITKSFTAAGVGTLVDEGRVAWDDPVTRHLPAFQLADPWVTREFTVRDLLSHRAGVERGDWLWYGTDYDRDAVVRHLRYLRPVADFRADYGYSNNMYIAAGQLIAAVTDTSWDDFVAARIFRPLGMTRSNTSVTRLGELGGNVAAAHERLDGEIRVVPPGNLDNEGPGGSINSSVAQMAQWIRLQLGEGEIDGVRLLDSLTIREMHTPQVPIRFDERTERLYPDLQFMAYGFGWSIQNYRGRKLIQHGGAFDGMRSQLALMPEERLGLIVLTNLGRGHDLHGALRNRILDAFLGAEPRDWSAEYLERVREGEAAYEAGERVWDASRVAGTRPSLALDGYVGTFEDEGFGRATVRRDRDALVVTLGPRHTGRLEHWHYDTFIAHWDDPLRGRSAITFTLDSAGSVAAMDVRGVRTYARAGAP